VQLADALSGVNAGSIVLTVEGAPVVHAYAGGVVSYTPAVAFANGQVIDCQLTASDNAGNAMAAYTWSFTIDTVAPVASNPSPANGAYTNDATPTISVQLADALSGVNGATIQLTVEGIVRAHSFAGGVVSWTAAAAFANGQVIDCQLIASDNIGNAMAAYTWSFTIDTAAPVASNPSPANGAYTNDNTPTISVQLADALSGVNAGTIQLTVEGVVRAHSFAGGVVSWTAAAAFANGQVIDCQLTATDNAGNAMAAYTWSFTIDTAAPVASNPSPANGAYTNDATPTISVQLADALSGVNAGTIQLTVEGVVRAHSFAGGVVSWTAAAAFANGQVIDCQLTASDNAGNAMAA
jgi:hypothetical protein